MSTAPGLAFANLTLLLDVPQLPAILASNICHGLRVYAADFGAPIGVVRYPFNRVVVSDSKLNAMGRVKKYANGNPLCI